MSELSLVVDGGHWGRETRTTEVRDWRGEVAKGDEATLPMQSNATPTCADEVGCELVEMCNREDVDEAGSKS